MPPFAVFVGCSIIVVSGLYLLREPQRSAPLVDTQPVATELATTSVLAPKAAK